VECSIDYGDVGYAPPPSAYTAFCYPGCLAGWAWGFNKHGICQSINALTSKPRVAGLGASFVSRDVLDAVRTYNMQHHACIIHTSYVHHTAYTINVFEPLAAGLGRRSFRLR
jgi:hypothetical protein